MKEMSNITDFKKHIRSVYNFPKKGINFYDITPLLADSIAFNNLITQFATHCENIKPTKVVGIDARGFILGAALANRLGIGFVPVRKKGKLPFDAFSQSYDLEYGSATLEIHKDAVLPNEKVIIVDDLLATGGTVQAAVDLLKQLNAHLEGIFVAIELLFLDGRNKINYNNIVSIIAYNE